MKDHRWFLAVLVASSWPLLAAATTGPSEVRRYEYDAAGNITKIGDESYGYDGVDRLLTEVVSGFERRHDYDAFGNRTGCAATGSGTCQPGSVDATRNRIQGALYDGTGNLTRVGQLEYAYDAVGMMIRSENDRTTEYIYDASDERIAIADASGWHWTLRDISGKVIREFDSEVAAGAHTNWRWTRDSVFRSGILLSTVDPDGAGTRTLHYHTDHLGTPRVVSDTAGLPVGRHDYHAFGHELSLSDSESPASRLKFTGHERDGNDANGLDYMHARYYSPSWGRFLTVDQELGDAHHPHTMNRYAYVENSPIGKTDPDGKAAKVYEAVAQLGEWQLKLLEHPVAKLTGISYLLTPSTKLGVRILRLGDATGDAIGRDASGVMTAMAISADVATAAEAVSIGIGAAESQLSKLVMLGKDPNYVKAAVADRGRALNMPGWVWESLGKTIQNRLIRENMDVAIARGARLLASNNPYKATGAFREEVNYLRSLGYAIRRIAKDRWEFYKVASGAR